MRLGMALRLFLHCNVVRKSTEVRRRSCAVLGRSRQGLRFAPGHIAPAGQGLPFAHQYALDAAWCGDLLSSFRDKPTNTKLVGACCPRFLPRKAGKRYEPSLRRAYRSSTCAEKHEDKQHAECELLPDEIQPAY